MPSLCRCCLGIRLGLSHHATKRSALWGKADEIGRKADIGVRMSAVKGKADVPATWPRLPLIAEAVEKVGAVKFCAAIVPVG